VRETICRSVAGRHHDSVHRNSWIASARSLSNPRTNSRSAAPLDISPDGDPSSDELSDENRSDRPKAPDDWTDAFER
jgi:hypothetical protein